MKKILLLLLIPVACSNKAKPQQYPGEDSTLNVENLKFAVYALPFKHRDIIIAQAVLETGWFTSENCKKNNNIFGMRKAYSRMTTADMVIDGYSHYPNWRQSVIDYYLLQSVTESVYPRSRAAYFSYLDKKYSEVGKSYSNQLKSIITKLELDPDEQDIVPMKHVKYTKKKHHR
jgi:hypothetical protein